MASVLHSFCSSSYVRLMGLVLYIKRLLAPFNVMVMSVFLKKKKATITLTRQGDVYYPKYSKCRREGRLLPQLLAATGMFYAWYKNKQKKVLGPTWRRQAWQCAAWSSFRIATSGEKKQTFWSWISTLLVRLVWCFEPSQPQRVKYISAEGDFHKEIVQSEQAESFRENLWNEIQLKRPWRQK